MNSRLDCVQIWSGGSKAISDDLINFWDESLENIIEANFFFLIKINLHNYFLHMTYVGNSSHNGGGGLGGGGVQGNSLDSTYIYYCYTWHYLTFWPVPCKI